MLTSRRARLALQSFRWMVLWLPVPLVVDAQLTVPGATRLLHVPVAATVPSGALDLRYDTEWDPGVFPTVGRQGNFRFEFGLLPRVSLGGRGTVANEQGTGRSLGSDLSANLQVLLLDDSRWWPALAVGLQDFAGAVPHFRSRYVVMSKSFFGRARGTLGFGTGPDALKGPFGGGEIHLNRLLTLMGEYDAHAFNAGVRVLPIPPKLETYGFPRATLDLIWSDNGRLAWGLGFRAILGEGKYQAQRAAHAVRRYARPTADAFAGVSPQAIGELLQRELMARGLENVRVAFSRIESGVAATVEYENRRYNRDALDGLGLVLGLTALGTPPQVTEMRVVVRAVDVAVLQVTSGTDAFVAFVNELGSPEAFLEQLGISQPARGTFTAAGPIAATTVGQRSRFKLDLFVRPRVETAILTDWGVADLRFSVLPDAYVQLAPGLTVNVRSVLPIVRTNGYPGRLGDPDVDRVLVAQAIRLPMGASSTSAAAVTQVSAGRFSGDQVGLANETAVRFGNGIFFAKGTVARLGESFAALDHWVALANARVRWPAYDATLSVTAGRFLDGDRGLVLDFSRFLGTTEAGVFLRHSEHGSLAGLRFAVPLTVDKELPPSRVRLRLPDVYAYEQRTTVGDGLNFIRNDIGRPLMTDREVERVFWNRDRLYATYIRRHVDDLRQAVRRWIVDES